MAQVDDIHIQKQTIGIEHILKPQYFINRESQQVRKELLNQSIEEVFDDLLHKLPSFNDRLRKSDQLSKEVLLQLPLMNSTMLSPPLASDVKDKKGLKVLLDGAPGVGKTTLCHNACKDWAENKLFTDFKLMVYVPLRENQVANAVKIEDLFFYHGREGLIQTVAHELEDTDGKDMLLVLDGWDELSPQQRGKDSLFCRIIQRRILPRCTVLITSRPYASQWLRNPKISNRHVEIFGLTEKQVNQCVQNMLHQEAAKALLQKLEIRSDVKALCYIPMNLAMILYVFKTLDFKLPGTLTGLFDSFTNNALLRCLQDYDPSKEPATLLRNRKALPDEIRQLFEALCQVAYDGFLKDQLVFTKEELDML